MDPAAAEGHIVPRTADLADEAFAICTAAADTTGNAMGMAAYRTITNPEIYGKVKKELQEAFPDVSAPMKFTDLEKLPYLTGIIKEGQRYAVRHHVRGICMLINIDSPTVSLAVYLASSLKEVQHWKASSCLLV
jgi:hypothetical protein